MIRLEQKLLPELQPYTQERAEALIDLIQSKGSTIARSTATLPVSGLKTWKICRRCYRAASLALTVKLSRFHSTDCCFPILKN